jgi:hypothetical protein
MPDDADLVAAFVPLATVLAAELGLPLLQMLQTIDGTREQRRLEWKHFPAPTLQLGMADAECYQLRGFFQISAVGPVAEGVGWFYETTRAIKEAFPFGSGIGPALAGRPYCLPTADIPKTRSAVMSVTIPYQAT